MIAGWLSVLFPGAGHIYAGRRRPGLWVAAVAAAIGAVVVAVYVADPTALLKLAFDPEILVALLVINAVLFVGRTAVVVHAYRSIPVGDEMTSWTSRFGVFGMAVLLVAPHGLFAYYDAVQYDLITTVFAAPTTTTTSTSTTAPPTTNAVVAFGSTTTTVPPTTTTTEPRSPWEDLGRLNVLLLGSDAGVGRTGVRTDTMILASIDVVDGDVALISVPRNFARVPLPADNDVFACDCFPPILNELYQYAEGRPESFPGPATPGANALKGAISELTGLPVHFYALVALDGFVEVVDALGGVTITVKERVYDPAYPKEGGGTEVISLDPGVYDFDGHEALAFARSRYSSDDYDRMGRQRCLLEAVAAQADPFSLLRGFPQLADVIKASVETDLPLDLLPNLIDLIPLLDTERMVSLRLVPPTYVGGWTEDEYGTPDVDLIREHVEVVTTLDPVEAMAALGIDPLEDSCD